MLFPEAWSRSLCHSTERMVEVEQEYPGGVEHMFSPGCVPLLRCSGCCNDEKLACIPIRTRNITIQLLRITPAERSREYVLLSFQEHQTCECRYDTIFVSLHRSCFLFIYLTYFLTFRRRRHHLRNQQ
ncbi:placenta growth factor [Chanodichthys erythropterus]|uniref:placenta growth factor n=1 Tax=Chanodichthys erythropterus TaxID=933992 RepID=UPI00351E60D0